MDIVKRELKRLKLWSSCPDYRIVCEANNGHEALKMLDNHTIDLIITDIKMPKVDGLELLKKVTAEGLCPCVVLMSDHCDFNYARKGLVLGAFDYLVKPVNEEELRGLLERAKEFIANKKNEIEKLQQLELELESNRTSYLFSAEISQLIELVIKRDERVREYAVSVAEALCSELSKDAFTLESTLNETLSSIANQVKDKYNWFDKFHSIKKLTNREFSKLQERETIINEFVGSVMSIAELLNKLLLYNNQDSLANQICSCVLENIDGNVSLKTVSELIFMNKSYISEAFKQKTGMSFTEYMTIAKIERAKKLMADEGLRNYEVAQLLGFKDVEYLSKLFKKHTGFSPSEYRQSLS
jgi:two-component system response regulator YesN